MPDKLDDQILSNAFKHCKEYTKCENQLKCNVNHRSLVCIFKFAAKSYAAMCQCIYCFHF